MSSHDHKKTDSLFSRIALVGDAAGLNACLAVLDPLLVVCLVIAEIRPQYFEQVIAVARERQIPLLIQPRRSSAHYAEFLRDFRRLKPDLVLSNSYSMLLSEDILNAVDRNAVNIYGSLLPRNRGPNHYSVGLDPRGK